MGWIRPWRPAVASLSRILSLSLSGDAGLVDEDLGEADDDRVPDDEVAAGERDRFGREILVPDYGMAARES